MEDGDSDLREPYRALLAAADRRLDQLAAERAAAGQADVADIDERRQAVTALIDLVESAVDSAIRRIR